MRKPVVADVMTRDLVTVGPDTPFKDVVDLIVGHEVSAVPVVDERNTLLGVVSEADLLCKEEHADDEDGMGPSLFALPHVRAEWRKATGLTARDLMTSPVLTISSEAFLPSAARELAHADVRRLFVVDHDKLVGVLARRDLLRGFLRSDADLRSEIEREVFRRTLWADPKMVRATVEHGVVTLTGRLEYQADVDIAVHLVRAMPGVVAVKNRLTYLWNGEIHRVGSNVPAGGE
jgi:CBS domain-containing protein